MAHAIATREEWLKARIDLLEREKALYREKDAIRQARMELPWVKIDKNYVFDSAEGPVSLSDLFDGRGQLLVQHFMLGPGWTEGCEGCSFMADHAAPALVHLENHDVTYVAISRAPLPEIQRYHARMQWPFRWVSSFNSDFNFDFKVSFTPEQLANGTGVANFVHVATGEELMGMSSFIKDEDGTIFHAYTNHSRAAEETMGTYNYLDMMPLGRNETDGMQDWMLRHDVYEHQPVSHAPSPDAVPVVSGGSGCGCGCQH
jgi:predicted dithiol-disulfide oxidoreductase (DUF899 family)